MRTRHVVATTVALSGLLAAGTALGGDNNFADVQQDGGSNSASVDQDVGVRHQTYLKQNIGPNSATVTQISNSNSPYFTPQGNRFGRAGDYALQQGSSNTLVLTQSFVGNNGNEVGTSGQGFEQTGNNNDATILQYGSRNLALEVLQSDGNKLSVTQGRAGSGYLSNYAYNRINSIKQTNTGGAQNQATIIQQGVADAGVMNKIGSLVQSGSGNDVQLTQTGKRNALGTVSQQTTGNHISLSITGNYNGSDGVDALNEQVIGSFATLSRGFTAASAVTQGSVIQNGSNNQLDYVITGNNNLFGFSQTSSNNIVGGSIGSSRNQLTISQTATGGTGHSEATVNISGGDYNDIAVGQSIGGGTKLAVATIDVDGSNNSLNVVQGQIGNGRNSLIDVSIDGDFNNSVKLFTTGNAAYQALGNSSHRLAGSGQIQQGGSGNQLTYDLTGSYNQFAFYQTSTNNTIVGSTVGNNSQTVVNQTGPNNTANFSQFGGGNVMGVMQ